MINHSDNLFSNKQVLDNILLSSRWGENIQSADVYEAHQPS